MSVMSQKKIHHNMNDYQNNILDDYLLYKSEYASIKFLLIFHSGLFLLW